MKINSDKSTAIGKTAGLAAVNRPVPKRPDKVLANSDLVEIAGIPEAELTPKVRAALQALMAEVESLRAQLGALRQKVVDAEALADRDPMLPILNRRAFVRDLDRTLSMVTRYGTRASIVFIDVNGLKSINDRHGHAAGDQALAHIAETIAANIRSGDSFARLGGDEFGLLLLQADAATAQAKAEDLAARIARTPIPTEDGSLSVSIAHGIVPLDGSLDGKSALERAEKAMDTDTIKNREPSPPM